MRPSFRANAARLILTALAAAAVLVAGCEPDRPEGKKITLKAMPPAGADVGAPAFEVRVVRLRHRQRPDAPAEDIWRLLAATDVPYAKRGLWERNGLRLGQGARLAAERMNELVEDTPDRRARVNVLVLRENIDFRVTMGTEREVLHLLWVDADGRFRGRELAGALPEFQVVCRTDPDDPAAVRLALMPKVAYGQERKRWVRTGVGFTEKYERPAVEFRDLVVEVKLEPGRLLVLGGDGGAGLGLGSGFFHETRGPDRWVQTLVITARRVLPGEEPPEGPVPLVPPAPAGE